jgi:hypothetical protein
MERGGQVLKNRPCANHWQAIHKVVGRRGGEVHAAIEARSGAAELAEELVARCHWPLDLAHPGFVARMKQNPDKRAGLPAVSLCPQAFPTHSVF